MDADDVIFLRDEVRRQISQANDTNEPEVPGVVTARHLGAEYLASLRSLDHQLNEGSNELSRESLAMQDQSLLWNIPSFCGSLTSYLDPGYLKNRTASRCLLQTDPLQTYTDDIWRHPKLASWLAADSHSLLLLEGDFDSATRIGLFGVEVAEHIGQRQPVALIPLDMTKLHSAFGSPGLAFEQMLRHIAIQVLRQVRAPRPTKLLVKIARACSRAATTDDWFNILKMVLPMISKFNMVLNFTTSQAARVDQIWLTRFQTFLEDMQHKPRPMTIRIMIISIHLPQRVETPGVTIISVRRPALPRSILHLVPNKRNLVPKNLMSLPQSTLADDSSDIRLDGEEEEEDEDRKTTQAGNAPNSTGDWDHRKSALASTCMVEVVSKPKERHEFDIAIFCALAIESDAVISLMDQHWNRREYGKVACDPNSYTLGAMGVHKVVLVHLPGMGKGVAASSASSCRVSFPGIRLAVVVGVCGGVPFGPGKVERILGDVVISDGLVQYDFGRQFPNEFKRKRTLHDSHSRPTSEIRSFLARLSGRGARVKALDASRKYLMSLQSTEDSAIYRYPGVDTDILYEPLSLHKHLDASKCPDWERTCGSAGACDVAQTLDCRELSCSSGQLVNRERLRISESELPDAPEGKQPIGTMEVHIGTIASGDKVMKSGEERDKVAKEEGIIAFEMEGAGIWDHFPCLIIKGICDYADCHKNKAWQNYAAATAAAYAKAVLDEWD